MGTNTDFKYHLESWLKFFKEYTHEPVNNIYVQNFDLGYALKSVINTFTSDFLLYQIFSYSNLKDSKKSNFKFYLPTVINVTGENKKEQKSYRSIFCKAENYIEKKKELNKLLKDKLSNKDNIKEVVKLIQFKILKENYLFEEFYDITGKNISCDEFFISDVYISRDEYHSKTDEINYTFCFLDKEEEDMTPKDILYSLFSIAVFTLRNKKIVDFRQLQSTKNALAKVMARNQSHNIGSHVLSRMVQPDDISIRAIMTGRDPKYSPINKNDSFINKIKCGKDYSEEEPFSKEQKKYYNKLISYFFSYLKTRQDLLADIVSGVPQVQSSKWFKEDIMKGIDDNRLLLNRISGVEDFEYSFVLKGLVSNEKEGDDVSMAISNDIMGQHAFYIILENIIRNTAKHGANKTDKTNHIFTICIKESDTDSSHYQITIYDNIDVTGDTYLKLRKNRKLYPLALENETTFEDNEVVTNDTKTLISKICKNNEFGNDDARGEFTDAFYKRAASSSELEYKGSDKDFDYFKISKIDHLVTNQNIWINKKILNEVTYDLRQQALGLIEMETCTAYLRRIEIDRIEAKEFALEFCKSEIDKLKSEISLGNQKLRLLRAVRPEPECNMKKQEIKDKKETENMFLPHLGYRFYLPKPKELLIIDETGKFWKECLYKGKNDKENDDNFSQFKKLERRGILLLNASGNYNNKWNDHWQYDETKVYQHSIMLNINKSNLNNKDSNSYLPVNLINKEEFCENFEAYFLKEFDSYKKRGYKKQPTFSDLLFHSSELFISEVWRAIVFKKYNNKGLKPEDGSDLEFFNEFPENNINFYFKFLHHGTAYGDTADIFKKWGNIEIIESRFKDSIVESIELDGIFNILKLRHRNSTLSNVLVLDERIQTQSYQNKYQLKGGPKLTYAKIWEHCNVIIPKGTKEKGDDTFNTINLNKKSFDLSYIETIQKIIKERFSFEDKNKQQCKGLDFLVIHLGILEKLMVLMDMDKSNPIEIEKFIKNQLLSDIETCVNTKVILISGRAPSTESLPRNRCFLSYSVLSQYLIENRFKFNLIETLNSARPKIK